jgi:hypothetical protein
VSKIQETGASQWQFSAVTDSNQHGGRGHYFHCLVGTRVLKAMARPWLVEWLPRPPAAKGPIQR